MTDTYADIPPDPYFSVPLSSICRVAQEGVVLVDPQQNIVTMNSAGFAMFGRTQAEVAGQPLSSLMPARYRDGHAAHFASFEASGATELLIMSRAPVQCLRSDGHEFPAEVSISRIEIPDQDAQPTLFAAVIRDLTVENDLRAEVALQRERFRTLFELSPVAMWIVEKNRITYANRATLDLFGLQKTSALIGMSPLDLLDAETRDAIESIMTRAKEGPLPAQRITGRILRPDGEQRDVDIATAALSDHGQTVLQMVLTDITQRQAQLREQAEHRVELRQLAANVVEAREEERRRIARELHDELGQRLSALKMELSGLRTRAAREGDGGRLGNMLEMVDDTVAAVRRIAADLRPLMLDDLGLNAAIEWLGRDAARRMDIEVTVRVDPDDPPVGSGAAIALYRMVQEALTNVGRHSRATEVHIELHQQAGELILTVRDNGVGFPERSLRPEGRFGLLGIRERAFMLGGRLDIDTPPGGGGRITVRLPLGQTGAKPGRPPSGATA